MSNHLAIATVSAALGQIAHTAAASAVPGVQLRFGRPPAEAPSGRHVNIFLYHVTPHAGLRNADLATRGSDGALVNRPRAALALHYLVSFYGSDLSHEPDRMAAAVVRDLHARPALTGQAIEDAIASNAPVLGDSDLADAFERVTFTPAADSLEEMSRLWSVMVQTPYALSLRYEASAVLIDATEGAGMARPVLQRGAEDRGPEALAGTGPAIDALWIGLPETDDGPPRFPTLRAAQLGARLRFAGRGFDGDTVALEFVNARRGTSATLMPERRGGELRVTLPDTPADQPLWAPGLHAVTAIVTRDGKMIRSAAWPMLLAPRLTAIAPNPVTAGSGAVTLSIGCHPQVLPGQTALLLLSGQEIAAADHPAPTDSLDFAIDSDAIASGDLAVLRIDGADSQPFAIDPGNGRLVFDDAQRVSVV